MGREEAMAARLTDSQEPDTQPVTQTLEDDTSCFEDIVPPPSYWGRLYPATRGIEMEDLTEESTVVGKTSTCDVTLTQDMVDKIVWNCMSKKHFVISRTITSKDHLLNIKIELTDLSLNGTFVNGMKVSRGKTVRLHNDAVIAVAKPEFKLYVFMESNLSSNEHAIIQKRYAVSRKLGSGSYGEVKLIFNKETGIAYAMKAMTKGRYVDANQKMEIEITILRNINHPNVMRLVDEYDSPTHKYLILHYMEGGDLCERISKNGYLSELETKLYFSQLVSGMIYLHDKGVIHRDLKPENVLLATNEVDTIVKITDFGLSKILETGIIMQTICGTKLYVAPEILLSANAVSSSCSSTYMTSYTEKVDVWSLGVMLYVCLSGKTPFTPPQNPERGTCLEDQIIEGKFAFRDARWKKVSSGAKSLIKSMMMRIPDKRISMSDIKDSPWLQDRDIDAKVEELVKGEELDAKVELAFDDFEPPELDKENKRRNGSFEEIGRRSTKRPKLEVMDCS